MTIDINRLELLIHNQTNEVRKTHNVSSVSHDQDLARIARYHSRQMADSGQIFHETPDGETLSDRLRLFDYNLRAKTSGQPFCHNCGTDLRQFVSPSYCSICGAKLNSKKPQNVEAGENVAYITYEPVSHTPALQDIATTVVEGWFDSQEHRENLLDERFEREGIGVAIKSQSAIRIYITQNFS